MTGECPTCGEDFSSERGMKTHHTHVHGESIAGFEYKCDFCGDEFKRKQRLDDQNKFCSPGCFGEYKSDEWTGKNNPAFNSETVNCDNCGSKVILPKSIIEEHNFCDESCYGEWKRGSMSGQNNPRWKKDAEKECPVCECIFTVKPSVKDERVTCSTECASEWLSDVFEGEGNPCWSGGYDGYYGSEWRDNRSLMLERYRTCQRCGSRENLHVHHIVPVNEHEEATEAHYAENLSVVCRKCHPTVESIGIEEQKEILK